jgi:hypothetical protein
MLGEEPGDQASQGQTDRQTAAAMKSGDMTKRKRESGLNGRTVILVYPTAGRRR